jgi:hypothetical protein
VCAGIQVNGAGLAYSYELAVGQLLQPRGYAHLVGQPCAFISSSTLHNKAQLANDAELSKIR